MKSKSIPAVISNPIVTCKNKVVTDEYIQRYKQSTMNAVEQILNMGESVSDVYRKSKSGELNDSDLEYFCKSVGLDSKGSTFRKYKQIGENAEKFRLCMEKLPSTFSVLYEMTTLNPEDFERFVVNSAFSSNTTLEEFKKIVNKSAVLTKKKLHNPPLLKVSPSSVAKVIRVTNKFHMSIVRNLPESKFNEIIGVLTEFRNRGWIQFEDLQISQWVEEDDLDDSLPIAA